MEFVQWYIRPIDDNDNFFDYLTHSAEALENPMTDLGEVRGLIPCDREELRDIIQRNSRSMVPVKFGVFRKVGDSEISYVSEDEVRRLFSNLRLRRSA